MDVESLAKQLILKGMTEAQQKAVLESIKTTMAQARTVQKQRIGENVQVVVQALKKLETDLRSEHGAIADKLADRIKTIKDGQDGKNGANGKEGKDGRPGRDGLAGAKGINGLSGRNGVDGANGVSVVDAHIDFDGSLIIKLSNDQVLNVGEVVSQDLVERIKVIGTMSTNASIGISDESSSISTGVKNINFVGATVTATASGDDVTVNVSAGTGSVTSVNVSGGTTGLTTSGGPVTTTGTITLGGTLGAANGGTGVTTTTGTGSAVLNSSPTLITPSLGTPSALVGTNISGTAANLTTGNVTTNANLTGVVTSIGNATSIADAALSIAKTSGLQTALNLKQSLSEKDASGGYAGLTLFALNLRNAANTITSFFTTAATVARTWTFPDKNGTVAMVADITGVNSGTNTGDQTIALTGDATGSGTGTFAVTLANTAVVAGSYTSSSVTVNSKGLITSISNGTAGTGTVSSVSVATANGVSGTVATATTTPAITLTLGAITPTSVVASGAVTGSNLSGTNTGDQTNISGNAATVTTNANLTGVITSVGNATSLGSMTSAQLAAAITDETGTGSNVFATSPTLVTPILGTPTSGALTNCTFPTLNQNTTGTAANVTGTVGVANGGTGAITAGAALTNLGAQATLVSASNIKTINSTSILGTGNIVVSANPAGATTQVQFNSAGVFAGSANLVFDGTNLTCGGTVTANSDERLKSNWRNLPENFIEQLSHVKHGTYDRADIRATQDGVSAQSLQAILPNSVLTSYDGTLSVAYGNAALVACIQLAAQVVALRAEINLLKERT